MKYPLSKIIGEEKEDKSNSRDSEDSGNRKKKPDLEKIIQALRGQKSLFGHEVAVYTEDGYHYGVLNRIDEDFIYLNNYVFDEKKLDVFQYGRLACFEQAMIPREKMKAIYEIPLRVRPDKRYQKEAKIEGHYS